MPSRGAGVALALLATLSTTAGCRGDVEGMWEGHVGGENAWLSLEQRGSSISGEICVGQHCDDVDGVLEEENLDLDYGCNACVLPRATLELVLRGGLEGERHLRGCTCMADAACACREEALFNRCGGRCTSTPQLDD